MGTTIMTMGLNILIATAVMVFGWFVAKIAMGLVSRAVDKLGITKSINESAGLGVTTLGESMGKAAYWIIILIALTSTLGLLGMQATVEPLTNMIDSFLEFIPNLVGAGLIFGIGYVFASVARRAVTSVLTVASLDKLSEKFGLASFTNMKTLPNVVGLLVFVLILLPVSIAGLDALKIKAISDPATEMLQGILYAIPNIFIAGLLLLITAVVARFVSNFLKQFLPQFGVDTAVNKLGLLGTGPTKKNLSGSVVIARVAGFLILLFGAIEAARLLQFDTLSVLLTNFLEIGGSVIFGAIIIGFGVWLAGIVSRAMSSTGEGSIDMAVKKGATVKATKGGTVTTVANFVKWIIIILASSVGLTQMGLANEIIILGFSLSLGAVALAGAIAFGLGGREWAAKKLEEWKK